MATIAVTGSSGFVGSYLVPLLETRHDVIPLDIKAGIDLTKRDGLVDIPDFDCLIHLAAMSFVPESWKNPALFYDVNLNTTLNCLELCRNRNARMIFTSSYVYGKPQYLPIDEDHPRNAFNPYAHTKIMGEDLCRGYHDLFGVGVAILRPFNIYGLGLNENFLIPQILKQAQGEKVTLLDPEPRRDFIYVKDLARAYLMAAEQAERELLIYNVASGESYSVEEVAQICVDAFNLKASIRFTGNSRKNEVLETRASIEKIKNELGWLPEYSFRDGICDIVSRMKAENE